NSGHSADLINRSGCQYIHRALDTEWGLVDFDAAKSKMAQVTKSGMVYDMFITEGINVTRTYYYPDENRNFNFSAMCKSGTMGQWGTNTCVPSYASDEYRKYLRYVTRKAIDIGIQTFSFAQVYMGDNMSSPILPSIIDEIKQYAASKGKTVLVGGQTNDISNQTYLRKMDYVIGGLGENDQGVIETGSCASKFSSGSFCWALLYNQPWFSNANNVIIHMDWDGRANVDADTFAHMSDSLRASFLRNTYAAFKAKGVGLMLPYGIPIVSNSICGSTGSLYTPDNNGPCKDESVMNSILGVVPVDSRNSQFISQTVPSTMTAGQTYTVSVTMKNTGTTTWTAADNYRLGSQNPQDNTVWGTGRVSLSETESIVPGQTKTFSFSVKAPTTISAYNFQWKMMQENVQWFGDSTPNITVAVVTSASCTDDCAPSGAKQCSGTTGYQTCGNYDTDTCLEWSSATACSTGQTCSGGTCSSSAANYSIPVSLGNTGSALSDYQVKITVPYNSHLKPSFDDIRFTASDGANLSYWRESYTASASAIFWVKVNSIPAGSSTIYLKYGDASASTASNGADTFVLYDDFNSGSVSDWTLSSSCGTGVRAANSSVYHSSPYSLQNYFTGRCGAGYSYSSRSFTAPVNGTYAADFYAKSMGCSGCTVSARLFFDNSQLYSQSISGAIQAGSVSSSLTAGTHAVKVGMYTTNAYSGTFQAYFDDIHVRKTASPVPTYSLGSEQVALGDGAGLPQVAGASTVPYDELQAKISQIQQSILLLVEQLRAMLSTRP
ncbi:MAG: DUF2341 domain-containing protein, partial [Candidatus Vogelbacteria bacterium]|nr:DUF2341 domain-containing protein [Candidatus Vogelbacteria bacterium]